jgi:hypothetical protein
MRLRCRNCNHTILSRKNKLCGFCREPLPEELLFTPAEIEAQEMERAAKVTPSIELPAERGTPLGLKPTLRQLMIVVVWAALMTAAARQMYRWGLYGTTIESYCQNVAIQVGIYLMPTLAILLWFLDRPGRVRGWYCSGCMIAAHFLGGFVFIFQDIVCYVLTGKPTMLFPMWPTIGLVGFWCGWKQWQTARPRDCPLCDHRSVIPIAVPLRPGSKRKYNIGKYGWCASCGAPCERNYDKEWRLAEPTL